MNKAWRVVGLLGGILVLFVVRANYTYAELDLNGVQLATTTPYTSNITLTQNSVLTQTDNVPYVLSGIISGAYSLTIQTTATTTLSGTSTYSGGTIITTSTYVAITNISSLGTATATLQNGSTLDVSAINAQISNPFYIPSSATSTILLGANKGGLGFGGVKSGVNGSVVFAPSGTSSNNNAPYLSGWLSNASTTNPIGTVVVNTTAGYFFPVVIDCPTNANPNASSTNLVVTGSYGATSATPSSTSWLFAQNCTQNNSLSVGSLSGNGTVASTNAAGYVTTYNVGYRNINTTFSGTLRDNLAYGTGSFALTKVGTGVLTLSGQNYYSATTTVSSGELQVNGGLNNPATLGATGKLATPVVVSGGLLSGTGTIVGTVAMANVASSSIQGGIGLGNAGTLTVGTTTFSGTNAHLIVNTNGTSPSVVTSTGAVSISGLTVDVNGNLPVGSYAILSGTSLTGTPVLGNTSAVTSGGVSLSTNATSVILTVSAVSLPTISSFSASAGYILSGSSTTLSWSVTNASSVVITPGGLATSTLVGSVNVSPTSTTSYVLTATNTSGSATSTISVGVDTIQPSVPSGLTATAAGTSSITLTWASSTDSSGPGVAGYNIFRCLGSSCSPTIKIATSSGISYLDTNLATSTSYTYTVSAYDLLGLTSATSSLASATTTASPLVLAANDPHVYYSPYNWYVAATSSITNSAGAYFKTDFTGTTFKINCVPEAGITQDWIKLAYVIDGATGSTSTVTIPTFSTIILSSSTNVINLTPTPLASGMHTVQVWVDAIGRTDRWIPLDFLNITGFQIDSGASFISPVIKPNRILQYGDSIMEGWGTLNGGSAASGALAADDQYVNTWSFEEANALNAEIGTRAFSGEGYGIAASIPGVVSGSYGAGTSSWNYVASGRPLNFTQDKAPDLIINNHGTNDGGTLASSTVQLFLNDVRSVSAIPTTTPIILLAPVTTANGTIAPILSSTYGAQSDRYVFYANPGACSGCSLHPIIGTQETTVYNNVMNALIPALRPSAPSFISATSLSSSSVALAWSAPTSTTAIPPAGYNIYRNGVLIGTIASGTTSYVDSGLTASTTYQYYVTAKDKYLDTVGSIYESASSSLLGATTLPPPMTYYLAPSFGSDSNIGTSSTAALATFKSLVNNTSVVVASSSVTSTQSISFIAPVNILLDATTTIIIPASTTITSATTTDFTKLGATTTVDSSGLPSYYTAQGTLAFGLSSSSLTLSQLVTITIPIDASYNSQTLTVFRKEPGETSWTSVSSCVVSNGICVFTTSNLSSFVVASYTAPVTTDSTSGSGGGGGGGGGGYYSPVYSTTPTATSTATMTVAQMKSLLASLEAELQTLEAEAGISASSSFTFTKNLSYGSLDGQVWNLQRYLNTHGFSVATTGAGSLDNEIARFGKATQAALVKFQTAKGISPASGYCGSITRAYLNAHP